MAPRDVYAIQLNNKLSASVNATVIFINNKGETNIKQEEMPAGESWKTGPFDYKEGTATFRYVVSSVQVKQQSSGTEETTAELGAPFEGIHGVTPLMVININPPVGDDNDSERIGSLEMTKPSSP